MFIRSDTGEVVSTEVKDSVMALTKILFRFDVISEEQALKMVTAFRILFV